MAKGFNRGLDEQMLEGGRGGGGGGGMGRKALDAVGIAGGLGVGSIPFTTAYRIGELDKERKEKREAAAEMKRETRGVEKTSMDRAREAAAEESMQRKVNKAAEDASKDMGFKKGGMTASKRADGIAMKGKTRGTIVMCGGGMSKRK
jgi:hypothetical protein